MTDIKQVIERLEAERDDMEASVLDMRRACGLQAVTFNKAKQEYEDRIAALEAENKAMRRFVEGFAEITVENWRELNPKTIARAARALLQDKSK